MTEQETRQIRVGETILGSGFDVNQFNHVRSGFRVVEVQERGLQVRRIHSVYLNNEPIESWLLRWDQLLSFHRLPIGSQIPLL